MSVVDDLLVQLREVGNPGEVVEPGFPGTEAPEGRRPDGRGVSASPAARSIVETRDGSFVTFDELLLRLKCPVLYTQVSACESCPHRGGWYTGASGRTIPVPSCCEIDGTCWRVEGDERERLKAAGELETAPVAYAAPWSKRYLRDAETRRAQEAVEAERRRQEREEELKAERRKQTGGRKGWGTRPIPGSNGRPSGSTKFTTPKPTPTEALAEATVKSTRKKKVPLRAEGATVKRGVQNLSDEQIAMAYAQLGTTSARQVAHAHWREWGYGSPRGAYMGLLRGIRASGRELPDGRKRPGFKTREAA